MLSLSPPTLPLRRNFPVRSRAETLPRKPV
jgi:hypothetical protein